MGPRTARTLCQSAPALQVGRRRARRGGGARIKRIQQVRLLAGRRAGQTSIPVVQHLLKRVAGRGEGVDLSVHGVQDARGRQAHIATGSTAGPSRPQKGSELTEAEAHSYGVPNECDAVCCDEGKEPIPSVGARRRVYEPEALIVADRVPAHASSPGQFSDAKQRFRHIT